MLCNYQNTLIHKSELNTHPTLINRTIKEYELRMGIIGTYKSIGSFSNSEIDSTFHYKESTAL